MSETNHTHNRRRQDHHPVNERNLPVAMVLNLVVTLAETAGSFLSGSLALLSDALHNLSNAFAVFHAYSTTLAGKKEIHPAKVSRLGMAGILSALLNTVIVIILTVFLIREAIRHLHDPRPVRALVMIVVGMIGLLSSVLAAGMLKTDKPKSGHIREIYNHQIINGISSAIVIGGGMVINLYQIYWIDPILTVLISLFLLRTAFLLLFQSLRVLFPSVTGQKDLSRMKKILEQYPAVRQVRHLQAWTRNDHKVLLEAHLEVRQDMKLSELGETRSEIEDLLRQDFNIHHITLQFDYRTNHLARTVQKE